MLRKMCVFTVDAWKKCGTHKDCLEEMRMILHLDENVVLTMQHIVSESHLQRVKFSGSKL